jgi:hypothetical protein
MILNCVRQHNILQEQKNIRNIRLNSVRRHNHLLLKVIIMLHVSTID